MESDKIDILIAGAHGHLGSLITKACLEKPNLRVNILDKCEECDEICQKVKAKGGKVFIADVTKPSTIKNCTTGIHTLISALNGDVKVIFDGQMALLEDGTQNGLQRFVPADFTVDLKRTDAGDDPILTYHKKFRAELAKTSVKPLAIICGMFMDTFFEFSMTDCVQYWGEKNTRLDLTAAEDVARIVAEAVSDPSKTGEFRVSGNELSPEEIYEIVEKLGAKIRLHRLGGRGDLKREAKQLKDEGNLQQALDRLYAIHAFDGEGKLHDLQNNQFGVKFTTVEDFLKKIQITKLNKV
jgi:nucleoside-diphosphate-sugar epimerase